MTDSVRIRPTRGTLERATLCTNQRHLHANRRRRCSRRCWIWGASACGRPRAGARSAFADEQLVEVSAGRGMAQLRHGAGLDLADPLAGETEADADLLEGARFAAVEAKPEPDDLPFPLIEADQHLRHFTGQQGGCGGLERGHGPSVFEHVAELGVGVVPEWL